MPNICESSPYWLDSAPPRLTANPLEGPITADVCILGGGVTGLSAAYHLSRLDPTLRVALLEAQAVGHGASGRNAGQAIVALGHQDFTAQLRRHGAANLAEAYRYVTEGVTLLDRLSREERIDCDWRPTGYLEVGLTADGDGPIDAYRDFLETIGRGDDIEAVPAARIERELGSPLLGKALFDRRGGQFNPLKLVHGLAATVRVRGVALYEDSPVRRVAAGASDIVVETDRGSVSCGKIILAANGYSHLLRGLPGAARAQSPLFVYANVTEPLSPEIWRNLNWPRRCGVNILSDLFFSFAPTTDGRILYVGGYDMVAPTGRSMAHDHSPGFSQDGPLKLNLGAFFPPLRAARTTHSWGGPISVTADFVPHVGRMADSRIVYAAGCWGHGVPIGLHNGRTLAELSLERDSPSTRSWLVTRQKRLWPNRFVAANAMNLTLAVHRHALRRKGRELTPQITFST
jgi:glycine/D-amino acid oxidase-like deaminating enzyme